MIKFLPRINNSNELHKLEGQILEIHEAKLTKFTYMEIKKATNDFDEIRKIGEGGYGSVYKAVLHDQVVAIKILDGESNQGNEEFNREVNVLTKVNHRNIIKLIGACYETSTLVYEFVDNFSLEYHLSEKERRKSLGWETRVRIASEICSALICLHTTKPYGRAHGDLKLANILLDSHNFSKLTDFGTCLEVKEIDSQGTKAALNIVEQPAGTVGYLDPQYVNSGELTLESDVFAFGIILLQLVTGYGPRNLRYEVEMILDKGGFHNMVDFTAKWPFKVAEKMARLGIWCSEPDGKKRPKLATEVLDELTKAMEPAASSQDQDQASSYPSLMARENITEFSYLEINEATDNFENIASWRRTFIGGSYYDTYETTLRGEVVAMKSPSFINKDPKEMFNKEVQILGRLRHPNIVKLIGLCSETNTLVCEKVSKGSLLDHLGQEECRKSLVWKTRVDIAVDICSALVCLHTTKPHGISYGYVHPESIVLDLNYSCKLVHFGLAHELKLSDYESELPYHMDEDPLGSESYIDPHYIDTLKLTSKSDVLAFGAILLKLVTGNAYTEYDETARVREFLEKGSLHEIVDPLAKWPVEVAEKMAQLGLRCAEEDVQKQPFSTAVLDELKSIELAASSED